MYCVSIVMMLLLLASCSIKDSNERSQAKLTIRTISPLGIFLANHNQSMGIENWKINRWKTDIKNLKKMGPKAIWYLPMQFGQYGKHINESLSNWDKPELALWNWPRSFNYAWKRENSFIKKKFVSI